MIKNYILYDENNNVKQFVRCDESEIELYQSAYIEIEDDIYMFDSSKAYKVENKRVVSYDREDKPYLLTKLNNEFEDSVAQLTSSTPQSEISTWAKQESEARAWVVDNNSPTPLLSAMCEARGCSLEYIAGKVIEKSDLYAAEVGRLLGEKQIKEKQILRE